MDFYFIINLKEQLQLMSYCFNFKCLSWRTQRQVKKEYFNIVTFLSSTYTIKAELFASELILNYNMEFTYHWLQIMRWRRTTIAFLRPDFPLSQKSPFLSFIGYHLTSFFSDMNAFPPDRNDSSDSVGFETILRHKGMFFCHTTNEHKYISKWLMRCPVPSKWI